MKQLSAENNPGEELEHSQVSNSEDKWERREEKKEKLFVPIQSINIMHPNEMNMIRVSITKRTEIIKSIQVVPFHDEL